MACHAHSYTDPVRTHDVEVGRARRTGLRGMHDVGEGSLQVVPSSHAEEKHGNESRSSLDEEETDHGSHDDEGCNHEAEHDDRNLLRPEDIHGEEESGNDQTARVDALLASIDLW